MGENGVVERVRQLRDVIGAEQVVRRLFGMTLKEVATNIRENAWREKKCGECGHTRNVNQEIARARAEHGRFGVLFCLVKDECRETVQSACPAFVEKGKGG